MTTLKGLFSFLMEAGLPPSRNASATAVALAEAVRPGESA